MLLKVCGLFLSILLSAGQLQAQKFDYSVEKINSEALIGFADGFNSYVKSLNISSSADARAVAAVIVERSERLSEESLVMNYIEQTRGLVSPYNVPEELSVEKIDLKNSKNLYLLGVDVYEHVFHYIRGLVSDRDRMAHEDIFAWQFRLLESPQIYFVKDSNPWAHCNVVVIIESQKEIISMESCYVE